MIISLARLPAAGLRFEHQYAAGELDVSAHEFELSEPPHITGHIKQSGMDVHVTGELRAALTVPCDRWAGELPRGVGGHARRHADRWHRRDRLAGSPRS